MKSKVIFEFEDRRIANILAMIMEQDTDLLEMINNKIEEYNETNEEDPIILLEEFSVDIDDNDKNVEHIIY